MKLPPSIDDGLRSFALQEVAVQDVVPTSVLLVEWPGACELADTHPLLAGLSDGLRHIARLIYAGATDAEIAHVRGRTQATVAKQVRRLLEVTGSSSRFHLVARLCGLEQGSETEAC